MCLCLLLILCCTTAHLNLNSVAVWNMPKGKLCTTSTKYSSSSHQRASWLTVSSFLITFRFACNIKTQSSLRGKDNRAALVVPARGSSQTNVTAVVVVVVTHSLLWLVLSQEARVMKLLDNMKALRFHISIIYDPTPESLLDRVISHECGRATSCFIACSLLGVHQFPPLACVCVCGS